MEFFMIHIPSRAQLWTGRVLSGLSVLFMLFDSITKVIQVPAVVDATTQLGYPASSVVTVGVLGLVSNVLYIVPQTAGVGAVLLTGYLGGAMAAQLRVDPPVFNMVFPVIMGALFWGGLLLRRPALRGLFK
jgi:hypothetical protein